MGNQVAYNPKHCLEIRGQGIKNSIKVLFNPHPNAVTSLWIGKPPNKVLGVGAMIFVE